MEIVEEERDTRAFLISSHRMDVVERLADSVLVLQQGEVACVGSVDDVCRSLSNGHASAGEALSLTDAMRVHLQAMRG
jgi:ABC-type uncharacterized transport system ATPase subunit